MARLCGASADGRQVQVVQSGKFRTHLAAGRALGVIAPVVVLLIVSSLILWVVVAMVSRAIGDIARQAAQQDETTSPSCRCRMCRARSRR
jgi:two-component system OmpR family sensor kinase